MRAVRLLRSGVLVEDLGRGPPAQRLAGAAVERVGDGGEVVGAVAREVGALGEVLAQRPLVFCWCRAARALRRCRSTPAGRRRSSAWRAGPVRRLGPRSNERRRCSGSPPSWAAIASRTASAPAPVTGGPFLVRGPSRPSVGGRCNSIVKRLVRSTSVPIAERSIPMIRSPSQCPGTARSAASAGRWLIITSLLMKPLPRWPNAGPGDAQRPAGAQARGQLAGQRATTLHEQRLVRSPGARSASTDHRGSRCATWPRSAPGSTPSPTCGPGGAACCGPSTA